MKKGQVLVRAKNKEGEWTYVDVLDLDDRSFKAFILDRLFKNGLVAGLKEETIEGERITLYEKK